MFKLPGQNRQASLVVEVLMIVVGINVALWFEGWFEDLRDAETEAEYLVDLRDDLLTDIKSLDFVIEAAEAKSRAAADVVKLLPELAGLPPEEQAQAIYVPASYQFFEPSDFTYRSMQESGDFRLLSDTDIKKGILRLDRRYKEIAAIQKNFLQALDDGYIPIMMSSFDLVTMSVSDPSMFDDQVFRNFFIYTKQDTDAMLGLYRITRSRSEELVRLIEEELGDSLG